MVGDSSQVLSAIKPWFHALPSISHLASQVTLEILCVRWYAERTLEILPKRQQRCVKISCDSLNGLEIKKDRCQWTRTFEEC